MVPLVPTFLPMVTLAPMVPLAAEKRSGFSCYQWYHWLPMVPFVKFPMVPLGEFRTHAQSGSPYLTLSFFTAINQLQLFIDLTANCRDANCFSTDVSGNRAMLQKKVSAR